MASSALVTVRLFVNYLAVDYIKSIKSKLSIENNQQK